MQAALRFLAGEWKGKVHIEQNLPPQQIAWSNRNQVIHVLVNLLQNSIDALAEKKSTLGFRFFICFAIGINRSDISYHLEFPAASPSCSWPRISVMAFR